jgi:hypothetical protein
MLNAALVADVHPFHPDYVVPLRRFHNPTTPPDTLLKEEGTHEV